METIDINKTYTFVVSKRNSNAVMPTKLYPASVTIPEEDVILDVPFVDGEYREDLAKQRVIRYCPRENSIFKDEQHPEAVGEKITIFDGVIQISGRELNKIQYLLLSNYNASKPASLRTHSNSIFKEWKPEEEADNKIIPQKTQINIKANILNMPIQDLTNFALAITKGQMPMKQIYEMGENQLRHYLMKKAEENHEHFDFDIKDATMQNLVVIKRAINEGHLLYSPTSRTLKYPNGSNLIESPLGQDPIETLAENAQQNNDYLDVIITLKRKMGMEETPIFTKKFSNEVEKVQQKIATQDMVSESIFRGIKSDVIAKVGTNLTFKGKNYSSKNALKSALEKNPDLWLDLQREIHSKIIKA